MMKRREQRSHNGEEGKQVAARPGFVFLILGVGFPLFVIVLELSTRMCALDFFDPMPSLWHTLLVTLVPASNLYVWLYLRGFCSARHKLCVTLNGMALVISAYYSLLFVPILPIAAVGIVLGIGLLPFAPVFGFAVAVRGHLWLRRLQTEGQSNKMAGARLGLALGLAFLLVVDLPTTLTRVGMRLAADNDPARSATGVTMLRVIGDEDLLLRSCYIRSKVSPDLISFVLFRGHPVPPIEARRIYYRVTGAAFNSVPQPGILAKSMLPFRSATWDPGLGGDQVANRISGLFLDSSTLDGSVDSHAVLGYLEWTLIFRNDSSIQREARAQIALPPGGVVSRLTLWIDGEEREAAYGSRSTVRTAYKRVVQRKRDPVLVTTLGKDRVLLQCFPVPPQGGEMKMRLGITVPLVTPDMGRGLLRLPHFAERNFNIPADLRHSVWIESPSLLLAANGTLKQKRPSFSVFAIRGKLADPELASPANTISCPRKAGATASWARHREMSQGRVVLQTLKSQPITSPKGVVVVVDASKCMLPYRKAITNALKEIPDSMTIGVVVASDRPVETVDAATPGSRSMLPESLPQNLFRGGCDNIPALEKALSKASLSEDTAVVWIHGPQPVQLSSPSGLVQHLRRGKNRTELWDVQAGAGPNCFLETLSGTGSLRTLPRVATLREDLLALFSQWRPMATSVAVNREEISEARLHMQQEPKRTSDHLVRLWAHEKVIGLSATRTQAHISEAVQLASRFQLVTPVTGAVVLEAQRQYDRAGLTPVTGDSVPTIPEPETWALMAVVGILVISLVLRRRRRCQSA